MSRRRFRCFCVGVFIACCFASVSLYAQERATIVGTVTDPSGAVMPGVKVTVTNTGTMASRSVETNGAGSYSAPELPIGQYSVKAEQPGFKTYERSGIVLNVNDRLRVDIPMQVGEVTQSVTVSEAAVRVQTESGEVSDIISGTQVTQLAINGRNFFQLAALTTGASSLMPDFNVPLPVGSSGDISFNGMRPAHNMYMIDGGENYDRGCGGCVIVMPSMDAIAEFKVQTSNYGADFGLGSAATVNMALKSGTQDFHGTLYEFVRNDALDANHFFANKGGSEKPPLKFNNYGWNVGGPFYIPGHYNTDKRKTFFFFNQEWRKLRQGTQFFAPAIPSAMRTGDFSGDLTGQLDASGNDTGAVFVPQPRPGQTYPAGIVAGQPFPGNIIPQSVLDSNAVALGAPDFIFPLPTTSDGKFFSAAPSVPINVREEILRVDQNITDKISVMAHFINEAIVQELPNTLWWGPTYPTVGTVFNNPAKHQVVKMTWMISPTLLNEASYNYDGNIIHLMPTKNYAFPSGVSGVGDIFPGNNLNRIPDINLSGARFGVNYAVGPFPWDNSNHNFTYRDDVAKMSGKHSLKFGGFLMRSQKKQDVFGETQGGFTFDGAKTAAPYQGGSPGNEFADFLLGRAKSYSELALQDRGHWRYWSFGLHFNDSWRITPRLTLQLGARWEALPHTYEKFNRQAIFYPALFDPANAQSPAADGTLDPNGPGFQTVEGVPLDSIIPGIRFYMNGIGIEGKNGIPRGLVDSHYDTIGPRIGFAWDIFGNGKTVLRGGYGEFFERVQGNDVYDLASNPPFSLNPTIYDTTLTGTGGSSPTYPAGINSLAKEYLIPTAHQFSFGLQRELFPQSVLSVMYVGTEGTHQHAERNINQPLMDNPLRGQVSDINSIRPYQGFAGIGYGENSISTNYHSLQVNWRTNNYHGLTLQTAYTWSHAIDVASTWEYAQPQNAYDMKADRGHSDYDRRHMLTMNYVYDLPFYRGGKGSLKQIVGGWQLSGITVFQTGTPFSVGFPGDPAGIGSGVRANLAGDPNNGSRTAESFFNAAAFAAVDPVGVNGSTGFGNAARNIVRGAGRNQWDISLFKNFTGIPFFTKEGANLQFRAEFFNAFNHTQFNGYFTGFGNPGFGGASGAHSPRVIQFALKLNF